jgi:hypothetical protein
MDAPQFDFNAAIPGPKEMGVSDKGRLSQIIKNGGAVSGYIDIIMSGSPSSFTKATMSGRSLKHVRPLGSRFFMDSIRKCKFTDPNTNQEKEVTMSEYVDMVPRGSALGPVVSRKLRESGFDTRGLIPGVLEDILAINPGAIFNSAKEKNDARCIRVRGLVNKKQADGSLDPNARHPDLQYLPEGVDWAYMQGLCSNPPPGTECVSKYVESKQPQPLPLPNEPGEETTGTQLQTQQLQNNPIELFQNQQFQNDPFGFTDKKFEIDSALIAGLLLILLFLFIRYYR